MGFIALLASHPTLSSAAPPKVTAPAKFRSTRSPSLIFATTRFDNHVAQVRDQATIDSMLAHQDYGIEFLVDPSTEQELAAIKVPDEPEATTTGAATDHGSHPDAARDQGPGTPGGGDQGSEAETRGASAAAATEDRADAEPHEKPKAHAKPKGKGKDGKH